LKSDFATAFSSSALRKALHTTLLGGAQSIGGESGIRTHDRLSPIHAFQACAFNRSAISPLWGANYIGRRAGEKKPAPKRGL
jgi:hypothetical protein